MTDGGFISGCVFKGRREDLRISYLLFVDDSIVFCEATTDQMLFMSWFFFWFEALSG